MERERMLNHRIIAAGLLVVVLALASCDLGGASAHHAPPSLDPVASWIRQHALPLRTVGPGGSDADLAPLAGMVRQASIVGLGEATHGTHEIIELTLRQG